MNIDIDDLLAQVSLPSIPQQRLDLQDLTRAWVAERVAPELLPWPAGLMERVLRRIAEQVSVFGLFCRSVVLVDGWVDLDLDLKGRGTEGVKIRVLLIPR